MRAQTIVGLVISGVLGVGCAELQEPVEVAERSVVGGDEAGFPGVGALVWTEPGQGYLGAICTATLIDSQWAVTAARCLDRDGISPRRIALYTGDDARAPASGDPPDGTLYPVDALFVHPDYDGASFDLGLVHLREAATETTVAYEEPLDDSDVGQTVRYVGFGSDDAGELGVKRWTESVLEVVDAATVQSHLVVPSVCPDDAGAAAFVHYPSSRTWFLAGVVSTVFGPDSDACQGDVYSTRVAPLGGWIAETLAGGPPSCLDDIGVCACDSACAPDGSCDNTRCQRSCEEVYGCVVDCSSDDCNASCYDEGVGAAQRDFDALMICTTAHCAADDDFGACVTEHCADQVNACLPIPEGTLTCSEVLSCGGDCLDADCTTECYQSGTAQGQTRFEDLMTCLGDHCEGLGDDAFAACLQSECGDVYDACMTDGMCGLLGGDCEEGLACWPTGEEGTACLPTDAVDEGGACDPAMPDGPECSDGLYCVDGTCGRFCFEATDCGELERCAPVGWASHPDLGVCVESTCVDADEDGVCEPTDCDDNDASTFPGADEVCDDGVDNDCDGETDEGCCTDEDSDGACATYDCDDHDASAYPGADEACDDGVDNDCDGDVDEGCCVDEDGDGVCEDDDCDDRDADVYPGADEVCDDGVDNDCDGEVDEGCAAGCTDADEDGICTALDCDDSDANISPLVDEICDDEVDNNCDGEVDEGCAIPEPPSSGSSGGCQVMSTSPRLGALSLLAVLALWRRRRR